SHTLGFLATPTLQRRPPTTDKMVETTPRYDAFLSYAGEDRAFAGELAAALTANGLRIWYDQTELRVGDSILKAIDRGLNASGCGVLVISNQFLRKEWPQYETDTLIRDHIEGRKDIL